MEKELQPSKCYSISAFKKLMIGYSIPAPKTLSPSESLQARPNPRPKAKTAADPNIQNSTATAVSSISSIPDLTEGSITTSGLVKTNSTSSKPVITGDATKTPNALNKDISDAAATTTSSGIPNKLDTLGLALAASSAQASKNLGVVRVLIDHYI